MKNMNRVIITTLLCVAQLLFCSPKASADVHDGTFEALQAAVADTTAVSIFNQTNVLIVDPKLGPIQTTGSLTINGSNFYIAGPDFSEPIGESYIYVNSGQTLNINNVGDYDSYVAWNRFRSARGAVVSNSSGTVNITNSVFYDNTVSEAGAIADNQGGAINIDRSYFIQNGIDIGANNDYSISGGVINSNSGSLSVTDSKFESNKALLHISNDSTTLQEITGGVINTQNSLSDTVISNTDFSGSQIGLESVHSVDNVQAQIQGGIINNYNGNLTVSSSRFSNNNFTNTINFSSSAPTDYLSSSIFGGVIYSEAENLLIENNSYFINNIVSNSGVCSGQAKFESSGGVIYSADELITVSGTDFSGNSIDVNVSAGDNSRVTSSGGAIVSLTEAHISNSVFKGNSAIATLNLSDGFASLTVQGGAIYNSGLMTITDSVFKDNYVYRSSMGGTIDALANGGAIYNESGATLNIEATNGHSTLFSGNFVGAGSTTTSNAIHLASGSTLNLNAGSGDFITFNDRITSDDINSTVIMINSDAVNSELTTGTVVFNDTVNNVSMTLAGGTLTLGQDNNTIIGANPYLDNVSIYIGGVLDMENQSSTDVLNIENLIGTAAGSIKFDANLSATPSNDKFVVSGTATGEINISKLNILADSTGDGSLTLFETSGAGNLDTLILNDFTAYTNNYQYDFDGWVNGIYNYTQTGLTQSGLNLAVAAGDDFSAIGDVSITSDLGPIGGDGSMTINGNGVSINGTNAVTGLSYSGVIVASGQSLTIDGVGAVDGSNNVLKSWNGFVVKMQDVPGMGEGEAGAITSMDGSVSISSSVFSNNTTSQMSGSVLTNVFGTATIDNSYFIDNFSSIVDTDNYSYGAIISAGSPLSISNNSTFINNAILFNDMIAADSTSSGGIGAAISSMGGDLSINSSVFTNNNINIQMEASGWTQISLYNLGGAIGFEDSTGQITNSEFTNNNITTVLTAMRGASDGPSVESQSRGGAIENNSGTDKLISIDGTGFNANHIDSTFNTTGNATLYTYGGAINNLGLLNITDSNPDDAYDSDFTSNYLSANIQANYSGIGIYGGAISNYSGEMTIQNTTFNSNYLQLTSTSTTSDIIAFGGAVYNNETMTITDSVLTGNNLTANVQISGDSASIMIGGGAIANDSGYLTIQGAIIDANNVNVTVDAAGATSGGITIGGGAIYNQAGLTITDSTFTNNYLTYSVDAGSLPIEAGGGAIYNNGVLNIEATAGNTTLFSGNTVNGVSNAIYLLGGNLYLNAEKDGDSLGVIRFNDKITANSETLGVIDINYSGAASFTSQGDVIFNNTVNNSWINLWGGSLILGEDDNSITHNYLDNISLDLQGGVLDMENNYSGDVLNINNFYTQSAASIKLDADLSDTPSNDKFIVSGTAQGEVNVSKLNILVDSTGATGALTLFETTGSGNLDGLILNDFVAYTNGYQYDFTTSLTKGIYDYLRSEVIPESALNIAVAATTPLDRSFNATADVTVTNDLYEIGGDGATLTINGGNGQYNINGTNTGTSYEGIRVVSGQSLIVDKVGSVDVDGNVLTSWNGFSAKDGAAIINEGILTITDSVFYNNISENLGGAINNNFNDPDSSVQSFSVNNSTFIENHSEYGGGGAISTSFENYSDNSTRSVLISNSTFDSNHSIYDGGAIYNSFYNEGSNNSQIIRIENSTFVANYNEEGYGGAIYNQFDNYSEDSTQSCIISNSTFDSNSSGYDGGAIYNGYGTTTITDSTFTNNSSNGLGGAILNESGILNIEATAGNQTLFSANLDSEGYNAIYQNGYTIDNGDGTFTDYYSTTNLNAGSGGTIRFEDKISSSDIRNVLNINSNLNSALTTGTILLNNIVSDTSVSLYDGTLSLGTDTNYITDYFERVNLDLQGGVLDMANTKETDVLNVIDFNAESAASITLDADLASGINDKFIVTGTATGTVNIAELNIFADSTGDSGYLTLFEAADEFANLSGLTLEDFEAFTTDANYEFTGLANGIYSYTKQGDVPVGLNAAVSATSANRIFTASADETVVAGLGPMGGSGSTLTINGGGYNINGTGTNGTKYVGVALIAGQTLNVNSVGSLNADGSIKTSWNGFSSTNGGAINNGGATTIKDSVFASNTASGLGGAVYNTGTLNIEASAGGKTLFTGNTDSSGANAVHLVSGTMNLNAGAGGSITFNDKITSADANNEININSDVVNAALTTGSVNINSAINDAKVNILAGTTNLNNASVYDNVAFNITGGQQTFTNVSFLNDSKIAISGAGTVTNITRTNFVGSDYSLTSPVISVASGTLNLTNSSFTGFTTATNGGAIAATSGIVNVANTSFTSNSATGLGGAIYNNGAVVNVTANGANVAFTNNSDSSGLNAVYLESGTLNLNTAGGSSITFNDKITSNNINNQININSPTVNSALTSGSVAFNNTVSNSTISMYSGIMSVGNESYLNGNNLSLYGGTVNMMNGSTGTMNVNNLGLTGTTNLAIDADLAAGLSDRITSANAVTGSGMLNINQINLLSQATSAADLIIADANVRSSIQLGVNKISTSLYDYNVSYNSGSGSMSVANTGFTPSVIATPVASSAGSLLTQTATYSEAFSNVDSLMFMPSMDRLLMRAQAKTAAADENFVFSPLMLQEQNKGMWFKQFTTFENVPLNNGPRVSNVGYGMLFGGDSELKYLGKGYTGYMSLYAGYNGSHQNYDSVGSYQNGGLLGITGTVYKGKFFAAMTMNTGASCGTSNTTAGVDNFTTIMAGAALKAGYNFEFNGGKFIVQPSLTTSYTFANTFDYTTSSGLDVTSDPLNAIQIAPGIKFIGNLKNGWQPYVGVNMVFNAMDSSRFYANNVQLPQLTVAPYVEYGVGVQRRWGERFTGFGQAMARGGGRNGVALQFGFRWALGKDPVKKYSQPLPKNVT